MAIGRPIQLTPNVASKAISVEATASQTSFTPQGGYRINNIAVYRNGIRLVEGKDFTAQDGTTVVLLAPATAGDAVDFQIFDDFNIAGAISANESSQTIAGDLTITGTFNADNISNSGVATVGFLTATDVWVSGGTTTNAVTVNTTVSCTDINVSGSATVDGQLSIGGTITYEDVTNVDSVGIVTGRLGLRATSGGLQITAGILTAAGDIRGSGNFNAGIGTLGGVVLKDTNIVAGVGTFSDTSAGISTTTGALVVSGGIGVGGSIHLNDSKGIILGSGSDLQIVHDHAAGDSYITDAGTGALKLDASEIVLQHAQTAKITTTPTGIVVNGICTVTSGQDFDGFKIEEGKYDTDALNGEFDFELENGHIQTHTGSTAGTYFPDFRVSSSTSLASVMDVGDVISCTLIVAASNTAHYCTTGIKIDNSTSNVTIEWIGSSAPTAGKGAGYDVYGFTIQKTAATPAYLVIVNATDAG